MSVKHFCDICGERSMDCNWEYALPVPIKTGDAWDTRVVYVSAESKWKIGQPKTTDSTADICKACFVEGLQKMIEKVRGSK